MSLSGWLSPGGFKRVLGYKPNPAMTYVAPGPGQANNYFRPPLPIGKSGNPRGRFLRIGIQNLGNVRIEASNVALNAIETIKDGSRTIEKYGAAFLHWGNRDGDGPLDLPAKSGIYFCDVVYGVENSKPLTLFLENRFHGVGIPSHLTPGEYIFHLTVVGKSEPDLVPDTQYFWLKWGGQWDQVDARFLVRGDRDDFGPVDSNTTYHIGPISQDGGSHGFQY